MKSDYFGLTFRVIAGVSLVRWIEYTMATKNMRHNVRTSLRQKLKCIREMNKTQTCINE